MKNVTIVTNRFLLRSITEDNVNEHYFGWINGSNKSQYIDYSSQDRSIEKYTLMFQKELMMIQFLF
jgi:hypothetical protein